MAGVAPCSIQRISIIAKKPPAYMPAERKHALAIGVDVTPITSLAELLSEDFLNADDAVDVPALPATHAQSGDVINQLDTGGFDASLTDATMVLDRLHNLAEIKQGGNITHTFKPEIIIAVLELKGAMKASTTFADVFALVAPFFFGSEARSVLSQQALSDAPMPSNSRMTSHRIRLDIMSLFYEPIQHQQKNIGGI